MSEPVIETLVWWEVAWSNRDIVVGAVLGVVAAASMMINGTRTPNPDTLLGKVYKMIEWASLTFGKAKQTGIKPDKD
jgi:hypothetical protein